MLAANVVIALGATSSCAQVMRGEFAGHKGVVKVVEQEGTVVVELSDAGNAAPLIVEAEDCGRIMPKSS